MFFFLLRQATPNNKWSTPGNIMKNIRRSNIRDSNRSIFAIVFTAKLLCEGERGTIQCNDLKGIKIKDAIYGRRRNRPGRCGTDSDKKCPAKSVLRIVKRLCDGRRSCDLFASSTVFGDPCKDISKYLHVVYKCKKGIPGKV